MSDTLEFRPLTAGRWDDLERLFGVRGACGGCWCMWWRIPRKQFDAQKGEQNRAALRALVDSGAVLGILAYEDGQPIGWCAVEPREAYPALNRSRTLKPLDEQPVWAVTCFFVARSYRKRGVTTALLRAAIGYVREQGGRIVEGYPVVPKRDGEMPAVFAWTGFVSAFEQAGFTERARRSPTRPIMRHEIDVT